MSDKQDLQPQELNGVSGGADGESPLRFYCPKCCRYKKYTEYVTKRSGCHTKLLCAACGTELINRN